MSLSKLVAGADVEGDDSVIEQDLQINRRNWRQHRQLREGSGSRTIDLRILREILGAGGQILGQLADELVFTLNLQRVISQPFGAYSGRTLGAHIASAKRSCAVCRIDQHVV